MKKESPKKRFLLTSLLFVFLFACSVAPQQSQIPGEQTTPEPTVEKIYFPTALPILTSPPLISPTATMLPNKTMPTPWVVKQGPGRVICPILLYHRIAIPKTNQELTQTPKDMNPYFVSPDEFEAQMRLLKKWGYNTITVPQLVDAINYGGKLPARPVIISFDDGDETVYTQAFPILKELVYTGTIYLVVNYIGTDGYMNVKQVKELVAANWEVGSHSMTHSDLRDSTNLDFEINMSRRKLEKMLQVPIKSFAYPFGLANVDLMRFVLKHYIAGMGLGANYAQTPDSIYYLWRRPVAMGWDEKTFGSFLPWSSPP